MAKSGLYTGLDIGTSTIKVLVAEYVSGEMNIIGVGNAKSDGLKNGTIVDIEKGSRFVFQLIESFQYQNWFLHSFLTLSLKLMLNLISTALEVNM